MDPITRLCAFMLCFSAYILFAYFLYWICETWDKYSKRKSRRKVNQRQQAFARDCERVGRALLNRDEIHKTVAMPVRKKPIRKAVGYYSDDLAQLLVK